MKLSQLQAISDELQTLLGGRLQGLRQHGPAQFSLELYRGQKNLVWLDLSRPHPVCHLIDELPPALSPNSLTLALRHRLDGARLNEIDQPADERILRWHWQTPGSEARFTLLLELSGRHGNLFLLDASDIVLQQLYPDHSRRGLRRGLAYALPEPRPLPLQTDPLQLASLPADGSRSRALAAAIKPEQALAQQRQQIARGLTALDRQVARARARIDRLLLDIKGLDDAGPWQRRGELLQGAYGQVDKGAKQVTVIDYFDPQQASVTIPLDPAKDLPANIRRCFQRSRKLERAAEWALDQLDAAEARLAELEALQAELSQLALPDGLAQPELLAPEVLARYEALIPPRQARHAQAGKRKPFREFLSLSGQRILVGRSARNNEALTFGLARGNDLWLHVRDGPGSHVIVALAKGQTVHPETLLDAATLALHYSEAKQPQAEVSYTPRKQVMRVKGGKAGLVQLSSFKTLYLRLEPERLARLLSRKEDEWT